METIKKFVIEEDEKSLFLGNLDYFMKNYNSYIKTGKIDIKHYIADYTINFFMEAYLDLLEYDDTSLEDKIKLIEDTREFSKPFKVFFKDAIERDIFNQETYDLALKTEDYYACEIIYNICFQKEFSWDDPSFYDEMIRLFKRVKISIEDGTIDKESINKRKIVTLEKNKMTNFDRDYLFLHDDHIIKTIELFNQLDKRDNEQRFEDEFQIIPAFLFLSAIVVEDDVLDQITLKSLYKANRARCESTDKDIRDISRTANEFFDGTFKLGDIGSIDPDYQVMIKNALDIYLSGKEIYNGKLSIMVYKMEEYELEIAKNNITQ
jgi:hypothetical protein